MTRTTHRRLMSVAGAAAVLALTFGSAAAGDDGMDEEMASTEPAMEMEPGLRVTEAWTRPSPMLELAGAAYMVIHNGTDADDALVAVSSPAAELGELHLSSMDDEGMMSMQPVPEIPVPAHGDAVLEPGGYHVMLIDLVEPLEEGTEIELTLQFTTAEPQTITVPVMAGAPMIDMGEGHDG